MNNSPTIAPESSDTSRRAFLVGITTSLLGCTTTRVQETFNSPEEKIQKKFGGMPLVFGTRSNKVPNDVTVTPSKNKKGIYVLNLPHLHRITQQEFEVDGNGNIASDIIEITITPFDFIASAIANKLNLNEGERYKVTIEEGTIYIRALPRTVDIANSGMNER